MRKACTLSQFLGGMSSGRLVSLVALAGLAVVTVIAPLEASAQSLEPQLLVGDWEGTWLWDSHVQSDYKLTVMKVEGNQVQGRVERAGFGKLAAANFNFVGTLEGDRLVFAGTGSTGELTIYRTSYGTTMRGKTFENVRLDVSLTKRK